MSEAHGVSGDADGVDRDLAQSPAVREVFGSAYDQVSRYAEMLVREGELRGLIGPRELPRLWERHIVNSAAVVPYLRPQGTLADIGSGAGLPGIVIAAMRPALTVKLIEPMERRCTWLAEVVDELGLDNVEILRGRAEEYHDAFEVDIVTARAVAALDKLARMSLPLLSKQGEMVVLKGRNVASEVPGARKVLRKYAMGEPEIIEAVTAPGLESTTVVRIQRAV
ncbi:16S rRNA m(7)G-527 methyltransferase [Sediminihabitans luteus]|uniref:Ribosomal RNA small subunit methyltransferase G n=1 Tax=Sediminihabitans luteus TaxID=1138585 RepID=A0A2M9CCV9_9CELL|nr:16S rRNA (guanine(527)-N(7))-methyltransferase RsmG [Sediminihabitans luteus]PJJ69141.1 16S rRNA m(7)G-527 methyltransferase [Sediminihabitans luteus]GII98813.1 ribosomal RNA small subunit methyltransferase G [Sediminihabitans luteus]